MADLANLLTTVTKPVSFLPGGQYVHLAVMILLLLVAVKLVTGKLPFGLDEVCKKIPFIGEHCMSAEDKAAHEAVEAAPTA